MAMERGVPSVSLCDNSDVVITAQNFAQFSIGRARALQIACQYVSIRLSRALAIGEHRVLFLPLRSH
eukprot:4177551-Amphidinium_carterae.1